MECAGKQVVTGLLRGTQQIICINTWKTYFELKPPLNVKTWRLLLDNLSSHHKKPCIIEGEGGNLCPVPVLISKIPTSWCTACEQKCSWSQMGAENVVYVGICVSSFINNCYIPHLWGITGFFVVISRYVYVLWTSLKILFKNPGNISWPPLSILFLE